MQKFVADVTGYYSAVALPTSVYFTHYTCTPDQRCLKGGQDYPLDKHYPVGKANGFRDTGLLDGDISGGQRYPNLEQLGPVLSCLEQKMRS